MIELQLYHEGRLGNIATGNQHEVGIALAGGILTMDDVLVSCPDICQREHTGKRVLVVIREDAGVLVVGKFDGALHCLLIA